MGYKHGLRYTRLYRIWLNMKNRCNNERTWAYAFYGERGITVCEEWSDDPVEFYNWAMSNGYDDHLTLDRIDGSKGYSPSNCRWVDRKSQSIDRKTTHMVEWNGEVHTLTEWSEILGIPQKTLWWRFHNWSLEDAFTKPLTSRGGWH